MACCEYKIRWFLPSEVVVHNKLYDLWVIVHNIVYDLSELSVVEDGNRELLPLLAFGGKDISWWFDEKRKFKTRICPKTGNEIPYTPYGPVLHVFEYYYRKELGIPNFIPWWRNCNFVIGRLTKNPRPLKILNTISDVTIMISVCEEETILEISERYKRYNLLCLEYTWFHLDKKLNMCKTLKENGIPDQRELYWELNLAHDFFVPTIHLVYDDQCSSDTCGMIEPYHRLTKPDCSCIPETIC